MAMSRCGGWDTHPTLVVEMGVHLSAGGSTRSMLKSCTALWNSSASVLRSPPHGRWLWRYDYPPAVRPGVRPARIVDDINDVYFGSRLLAVGSLLCRCVLAFCESRCLLPPATVTWARSCLLTAVVSQTGHRYPRENVATRVRFGG
jgi:hypothetical protein